MRIGALVLIAADRGCQSASSVDNSSPDNYDDVTKWAANLSISPTGSNSNAISEQVRSPHRNLQKFPPPHSCSCTFPWT